MGRMGACGLGIRFRRGLGQGAGKRKGGGRKAACGSGHAGTGMREGWCSRGAVTLELPRYRAAERDAGAGCTITIRTKARAGTAAGTASPVPMAGKAATDRRRTTITATDTDMTTTTRRR